MTPTHEQAVAKFESHMEKIYKPGVTAYQRAEQLEKWRLSGSIAPTVQLDYLGVEIQTRLNIFKNETYKKDNSYTKQNKYVLTVNFRNGLKKVSDFLMKRLLFICESISDALGSLRL